MKQILIILGLFASVSTFAQSPRIKLNQITKDTVKGSVLISSPSDSGMVYSRDFYIAYGADTVLILYGDTLAATSGIISSVLSDGVTITGNGTSGNELKVDTSLIATIKALNDSLSTISASTTPDGVTITGDGSVGNPLKVDTSTVISTIQGLVDTLTNRGYLTANQTITLSGDVTGSGTTAITATVVDDSHNHIISNIDFLQDSLNAKANASELSNYLLTSNYIVDSTRINATGDTAFYYQNGVEIGSQSIAGGGGTTYNNISETADTVYIDKYLNVDTSTLYVDATTNRVGIGTSSLSAKLEINAPITSSAASQFLIKDGSQDGFFRITEGSSSPSIYFPNFVGVSSGIDDYGLGFLGGPVSTRDIGTAGRAAIIFDALEYDVSTGVFSALENTHLFAFRNWGTNVMFIENDGEVLFNQYGAITDLRLDSNGKLYDGASDERLKNSIENISYGLKEIMLLQPKQFWRNEDAQNYDLKEIGFIAQEVRTSIPNAVVNSKNGYLQLRTNAILATTVKAIQEQQTIIETQQQTITDLQTTIQALITRIENLENK